MKKSILMAMLLLCAVIVKAQTVTLKYGFAPKSLYKSTFTALANMDMQGPNKSPLKMLTNMTMGYEVKTQARKTDGTFPIALRYTDFTIKANMNGAEQPMPGNNPLIGQVVYGQGDSAGKMHIDSIAGGPDDQKKAMVMQLINQIQDQMKFPDKPMKVGESATIDLPFKAMGMAPGMDMNTKATYKLIAVKNGLAYFDVLQSLNMNVKQGEKTMSMNASGDGKMVYDIAQQFPTAFTSNLNMTLQMPEAGAGNMKMSMTMEMKTAISAN